MNSMKIVAVASSEEVRAILHAQLQALDFVTFDGVFIELSDTVRACQEMGPDVIIVDTTARELDAGLFIQAIGMNPENPCVIYALHRDMDINVFKESIRQGAKQFIQYPEDKKGLEVALKKHFAVMQHLSRNNHAPESASSGKKKPGKLITCFAPKGGVGCSTVAVNLAYELNGMNGQSVVFVDLDQVFCNSAIMLNHKPSYSLGDIADNNPREVDEALLSKIIMRHESGLNVVVGSKSVLDDNDMIDPELLDRMMDYLVATYDVIVVDLPTHVLDPYHQYMVERADEVLLVSCPDIPSLYRTRQYLDLAQKYLNMGKIKMVLNRYNMKAAYRMSNQDVEQEFRYDIYARIPNDWDLNVEANSFGSAWGKVNAKAETVRAIQKLASRLMDESTVSEKTPAVSKSGKSFWQALLSGKKPSNKTGK